LLWFYQFEKYHDLIWRKNLLTGDSGKRECRRVSPPYSTNFCFEAESIWS
ncbi:hypothetical protein T01_8453, partial [Trichinella spiralis]